MSMDETNVWLEEHRKAMANTTDAEYYRSHYVQEWCDFPVEYEAPADNVTWNHHSQTNAQLHTTGRIEVT